MPSILRFFTIANSSESRELRRSQDVLVQDHHQLPPPSPPNLTRTNYTKHHRLQPLLAIPLRRCKRRRSNDLLRQLLEIPQRTTRLVSRRTQSPIQSIFRIRSNNRIWRLRSFWNKLVPQTFLPRGYCKYQRCLFGIRWGNGKC